jgi:hypothetical protein
MPVPFSQYRIFTSAPSLHKCHKALLFMYFMVYKISLKNIQKIW